MLVGNAKDRREMGWGKPVWGGVRCVRAFSAPDENLEKNRPTSIRYKRVCKAVEAEITSGRMSPFESIHNCPGDRQKGSACVGKVPSPHHTH